LPALNNARNAAQSSAATAQTSSQGQNSHVYPPKSARQAAEIHSLSQSDQRQSASPSSPANNSNARSRKKDQ
jgi:hypothetical protein